MADLEVTHLLALANSRQVPAVHDVPGAAERDHLSSPDEARSFLVGEGVPVPDGLPTAAELDRLKELRDLAHDVEGISDERWAERLTGAGAHYLFRIDAAGRFVPASAGWEGFAASMLPQLHALREERHRLRRCANPTCQWLFVDESKNHSRVWCDMSTCGSRAKMTRYRSRRKGTG